MKLDKAVSPADSTLSRKMHNNPVKSAVPLYRRTLSVQVALAWNHDGTLLASASSQGHGPSSASHAPQQPRSVSQQLATCNALHFT